MRMYVSRSEYARGRADDVYVWKRYEKADVFIASGYKRKYVDWHDTRTMYFGAWNTYISVHVAFGGHSSRIVTNDYKAYERLKKAFSECYDVCVGYKSANIDEDYYSNYWEHDF